MNTGNDQRFQQVFNTMILRRIYNGAAFNSPIFKIFGPVINIIDKIAQPIYGVNREMPIPPFTLRSRSNGVIRQFGGKRFEEQPKSFIKLLETLEILAPEKSMRVFEIGCGVGRFPRALDLSKYKFKYVGIDIDSPSVAYCKKTFDSTRFSFKLIDASNGTYRPDGAENPESVSFDMVDAGTVDLVVCWSVFTHMEIAHIRHYLKEIAKTLSADGMAVLSAFVYDDRDSIVNNMPHSYNEGYTVNLANPMKAIAFSEAIYQEAFAAAGLKLVRPYIPKYEHSSAENHSLAQGQDLFLVKRA